MEDALRRAMVLSDGDWTFLFSSGIAIGLWIAAIAGFRRTDVSAWCAEEAAGGDGLRPCGAMTKSTVPEVIRDGASR